MDRSLRPTLLFYSKHRCCNCSRTVPKSSGLVANQDIFIASDWISIVVAVSSLSCVQLFATLCTVAFPGPSCPLDFPSKNTRVGCHFPLQQIFPTQDSNLHLLHCRRILLSPSLPATLETLSEELISSYYWKSRCLANFRHPRAQRLMIDILSLRIQDLISPSPLSAMLLSEWAP